MSAAFVSLLAVGTGQSTLLRSGSKAAMVPAEGGCSVISGRGSAACTAVPGAGAGIPGDEARVPEAGAKAIVLGAECCHLAGEVLNPLQKCSVVGGVNANVRRLGCILAVRTAGSGVKAAFVLVSENGLYVGGWGSRQDQMLRRK
jgi:hypothetical protein